MTDSKILSFVRIAEIGSFTEAAESLFISPAALSHQIKNMEQELGFSLFDRSSRKAKLTAAGRQFLPIARQLVQTYENSLLQCRITATLDQKKLIRLRAACLNDEVFTIWSKMSRLIQEEGIAETFPRVARYPSRLELYRALLRNEEDFTILLENDELYSLGLEFHPLTNVPEFCYLSFPTPELDALSKITLDDFREYSVLFHFAAGHTTYEDALREQLYGLQPDVHFLEPKDFFDVRVEFANCLLLVPSIQYSGDLRYVRPLDWGTGLRLGFVTVKEPKPEVMRFVQQMQAAVQNHPELWQF